MSQSFESIAGHGVVLIEHESHGLLAVQGADRIRFLHAMLSNDIDKLPVSSACRALLLNRKGRVLSMLLVLREPDRVWIDAPSGTAGAVREVLEKHVIADDVRFEDLSTSWRLLSIEGPAAREHLASLGLPAPAPNKLRLASDAELWCGGGELGADGARVFATLGRAAELVELLGLPRLDARSADDLYVHRGVPRYGIDVTDHNFPQEARLERDAVSFKKGCYIGQEIVARIQSRGAVNRLLVQLELDAPVEPGAVVSGAERSRLGEVTSVAPWPEGAGAAALAYVKVEHATPGLAVRVGDIEGRISGPVG